MRTSADRSTCRSSGSLSRADDLCALLSPGAVVRADEPMARRTTLRVGGAADLYIEPATESDLSATLRFCESRDLPVFILGRGSNLLVRDGGVRGAVICLAQPHFSRVEVINSTLRCGAGARLRAVAAEAKRAGLSGLEFLDGIPGSVGGALRMNAGAHGDEMFGVARRIRVMDFSGNAREVSARELPARYRSCDFFSSHVAIEALLQARPDERSAIERRMNDLNQCRWASQPAAPSAGCMFKNPESIPAGKLVDELGLKGTSVGGARVSREHGNFIVTDGPATASDVLRLINQIRDAARVERGIELETEVRIVGEEACSA